MNYEEELSEQDQVRIATPLFMVFSVQATASSTKPRIANIILMFFAGQCKHRKVQGSSIDEERSGSCGRQRSIVPDVLPISWRNLAMDAYSSDQGLSSTRTDYILL